MQIKILGQQQDEINVLKNTVLTLQTLEFREDWQDIYSVVTESPEEFIDALSKMDIQAIQELGLERPLPDDFLRYVAEDAPGSALLKAKNLEDYIYSGEVARSPYGPQLLQVIIGIKDALRELRDVKNNPPDPPEFGKVVNKLSKVERQTRDFDNIPVIHNAIEKLKKLKGDLMAFKSSDFANESLENKKKWISDRIIELETLLQISREFRRTSALL